MKNFGARNDEVRKKALLFDYYIKHEKSIYKKTQFADKNE
jgi:hypothetical protein